MLSTTQRSASRPLASLIAVVAIGVSIFFALYSLMPITRADSPELGSLFVGTLMGFVMGVQVFTPLLIRRLSLRTVVAGSVFFLALGALLATLSSEIPLLLTGAGVGGAGFGILIVAGAQGVAILVPPIQLGRTLGVYGMTTMASSALGAPAGLELAIAFSPQVFGWSAFAAGLLSVGLSLGIPVEAGRGAAASPTMNLPEGNIEVAGGAAQPGHRKSLFAGVPWLVLGFLLLGVMALSHGLTSLPALATAYGSATLVVFAVQSGNAVGRWVGGTSESKFTAAGVIVTGAALIAVGVVIGVFSGGSTTSIVSGALVGLGAGAVQTVTLHTAMLRMEAGKASVVWNLAVDGGFWVGGILWGIALAYGFVSIGVIVVAAATVLVSLLLIPQLRHQR